MQTESALGAQRGSSTRNTSGLRRLSLAMLATERTGETFTGLPEKSTPGRVLAAFKAAAPALGYKAQSPHRSENGQLGEHNVPNGWLIVSRRWQYD